MELSIIIPVYNAEKYIKECLDSIMVCGIKEMECILVNDGSRDSSFAICQNYVEKDNRFKLVDKENGGVSSARNTGIGEAIGRYIMFLDADDYMDSAAWSEIADCIKEHKYDFVAYSYFTLHRDAVVKEELFTIEEKECTDKTKIREFMLASSCLNTCWGKLFLLKKIIENDIEFCTDLKIGEDFVFVADYFHICTAAIIKNKPILYYRKHSGSAMRAYDLDTRIVYTDILFSYSKGIVLAYKDEKLLSKMYVYYLRVLTNLFLEFSKGSKINKLKKEFRKALQNESIKEIVSIVELSKLSSYKWVEGILLKKNWFLLLVGYFKLKSCFNLRVEEEIITKKMVNI